MIIAAIIAVAPNMLGASITALIGSLGATIAVTYYFLGFLRNEGLKRDQLFAEFRDHHAESQKKFQDQIDQLADRLEALQRSLLCHVSRMSETQNSLWRDSILAMKAVEKTLDNSTATICGTDKTIKAMQVSLDGIDTMIRRIMEIGFDGRATPREMDELGRRIRQRGAKSSIHPDVAEYLSDLASRQAENR